jgi:hypothetical protein
MITGSEESFGALPLEAAWGGASSAAAGSSVCAPATEDKSNSIQLRADRHDPRRGLLREWQAKRQEIAAWLTEAQQ